MAIVTTDVYPVPQVSEFNTDSGLADYKTASDLEPIAAALLQLPEFEHLKQAAIVLLWKREGGQSKGHDKLGECIKTGNLVKYFSENTWVIWLAADHTRDNGLTYRQVEAALYHELMHAGVNEKGAPAVFGHDTECFSKEITRYGAWRGPLVVNQRAWKQAPLFGQENNG